MSVVWTETLIMPEPQARALLVLQSILLSQGQFIYHDNALYISNYYFYFIEGTDVMSGEVVSSVWDGDIALYNRLNHI